MTDFWRSSEFRVRTYRTNLDKLFNLVFNGSVNEINTHYSIIIKQVISRWAHIPDDYPIPKNKAKYWCTCDWPNVRVKDNILYPMPPTFAAKLITISIDRL